MKNLDGKVVAFYAPMKSPHDDKPSGDREIARNLMALITSAGGKVVLASTLCTRDKIGDLEAQAHHEAAAKQEIARLLAQPPSIDLWVTYHNYYKAPDLIGPAVTQALQVPYVQIESTRAQKRLKGPWSNFAKAAHSAADHADVIFYFTQHDYIALERDRANGQTLVELHPFLPQDTLPPFLESGGGMLSVGMMRKGDKLASYQLIAQTLHHLEQHEQSVDWQLSIAGDGPARVEVQALMAPYESRVKFLGQLSREELSKAYAHADLFFWPGVNEAFGMVYLEAQSYGLPVIAQDRPGVRDVLSPSTQPSTPELGPQGLAAQIRGLLVDQNLRSHHSQAARAHIARKHLAPVAKEIFTSSIGPLLKEAQ